MLKQPWQKQAVQGENNNGEKDGKSSKSDVKVSFHTSVQHNHSGRSPAEFMLSRLWIASRVRPLKTSTANMAISFPSAAVYQCHTGSTMQNLSWLSAPQLHKCNPSTLPPLHRVSLYTHSVLSRPGCKLQYSRLIRAGAPTEPERRTYGDP